MTKKIILFLTFMFLGNFIPCFTKNNDAKSSSEIKNRSKKIGKTKYPKSKQQSVASKIGNLLKDAKDTIEGTLAQGYEAISQTNDSALPFNQKHNYYSEGPLPDDYEPEGLKNILPSQNNNALKIQENNVQKPQNEPITNILAPDCQKEEYPAQQSTIHIEPVLKENKPAEQQEINIPSIETIMKEPPTQPSAELLQPSGPTLAGEIYDGTIWCLKKIGRGLGKSIRKTSEWAKWASDKADELRVGIEEKQKKEKEDLRRKEFIERFERVQKAKTQNEVNILNQHTKIEDKKLPITFVQPDISHDFNMQIDDIEKYQIQDIPANSEQIDSSNMLPIDTQKHPEQQNIKEKIIIDITELPEIRQDVLQDKTKQINAILDNQVSTNDTSKNNSNLQEIEILKTWSEKPKDEILSSNQDMMHEDIQKKRELFKLFEISCDKKQLMYYGAGAVVLITVCGVVAYVFYKNGTYKKVGKYIGEHKFAVSGAMSAVCALVIAGIYARQQGITMQNAGTWITNLFGRTESI